MKVEGMKKKCAFRLLSNLGRVKVMELVRKFVHIAEAVSQRCFVKKVFLKISQNSQKKTCDRVSFLIKLQETRQDNDLP